MWSPRPHDHSPDYNEAVVGGRNLIGFLINLEPHSSILSDHFSDHTEQKHVVSGTAALSKLQAVNDV